jgi:hypothetical protein
VLASHRGDTRETFQPATVIEIARHQELGSDMDQSPDRERQGTLVKGCASVEY